MFQSVAENSINRALCSAVPCLFLLTLATANAEKLPFRMYGAADGLPSAAIAEG